MNLELKSFQEIAADKLFAHTRKARRDAADGEAQAIVLSSPTGSGKTITLTQLLEFIFNGDENKNGDREAVFLWLSDSPELNRQSRDKIQAASSVFKQSALVTVESFFDQERFDAGKVYFLNTQKLAKDTLLTKTVGDNRTWTIWQTIQNTAAAKPGSFYVIIDEAHRGMAESKRAQAEAQSIMQRFIKGWPEVGLQPVKLVVGMSATPERFNELLADSERTIHKCLIKPHDVRVSGLTGMKDHPAEGYQSTFSHADESASAGYYKVKLQKSGVTVELTAGDRAGILRFTFPASDEASIMTDLSHVINGGRWRVAQSRVRIEDNSTITGFHLINGWAKERYLYFAARYSRPFDSAEIISAGKPVVYNTYRFRSSKEAAGTNLQFIARYKTHPNEVVKVKVAVSAVSAANALENLDAEIPDWDFAKLLAATRAKWNRELSKIEIEGSPEQKETFYTSLYHAFLAPNLYQDVNGEYRGFDQNIHQAKGFTEYSVFSLWDTYRATHPLFALIQSRRDADMINSLLVHYDQSVDHLLPMWELQGNETWCMIGYQRVFRK